MAKQVQFRRGTTSQHSSFTGAVGEITVDTDKDTVVVHDGSTAGGHPLVKQLSDLSITATATELNYNDITTLGTVEASKVVTADANGDVTFPDGEKLKLGTGGDLEIYHDASNAFSGIVDTGTGPLAILTNQLLIQNDLEFKWLLYLLPQLRSSRTILWKRKFILLLIHWKKIFLL